MAVEGALCVACEEPVSAGAASCPRCGGALELDARFTLIRLLGAGGQSRVYEGRDRDGAVVAVKVMSIARARDWKSVELFRRASTVLGGLRHPSIPKLVHYFEEQRPGMVFYCLVHELIDGETLAHALAHGERFDDARLRDLLREALGVLSYLHGLSPPVIHRDLKPSNFMRRRDGRLMLIDFDLARDVLRPEGGSTVAAGTPGYAPMEQFVGEAVPATDLYALGVTLVVLASRKEPLELRAPGSQKLDFRRHVQVSAPLARVLSKLLEPEVARRYPRAEEVLADLDRPEPAPPSIEEKRKGAGVAIGFVAVSVVAIVGGAILMMPSAPDAPPPVVAPPIAAAPPPPLPTPPRRPTKPAGPIADRNVAPAEAERVLCAQPWIGSLGGGPVRLEVRATPKGLRGEIAEEAGRPLPVKVEITGLGSIVLRWAHTDDGVRTDEIFSADLATTRDALVGTRERILRGGGSAFADEQHWTLRAAKNNDRH